MCERVTGLGNDGLTVAEIARALNVSKATIYKWAKEHEAFSDALTCALDWAEAYWAKHVRDGLGKPPSEFQASGSLKYMSIRFRGWREKLDLDDGNRAADNEPETPDDPRAEARRIAFMLARGLEAGS